MMIEEMLSQFDAALVIRMFGGVDYQRRREAWYCLPAQASTSEAFRTSPVLPFDA